MSLIPAHPQGEGFSTLVSSTSDGLLPAIAVDTVGRRFHVEWDPEAPVTPLGQLVFFCQFLAAGGLYSQWVAECPLRDTRPNAPRLKDLLGTWVLASLSGAWRYAHVTALRGDRVNPLGLGMEKVVAIPAAALMDRGQLQSVFVVEDGTAHTRLVTTGRRAGDAVEVLSGLNSNEKIVLPLPPGLQDGAKVEVRQ